MRIPVAKESYLFLLLLLILSGVLLKTCGFFSIISLVVFVLTALFFRDPKRKVYSHLNEIVSPADGRIIQIKKVEEEGCVWNLVSIFMSPLNVHINYAPMEGEVLDVAHKSGSFLRADHKDASTQNESNTLLIRGKKIEIKMRQIAGLFARRIVCYCKSGDFLNLGQKIGLIQFGSRVDLYFPLSLHLKIKEEDRVKGAQTILGIISPK
ncbi:MAG: phosphatidylserine decarboxylase [Chlamydiae bacterium]|nr:phosphatidylserine decarboxylase [Chlamydiota bacterium]MBI3276447.1 phosphatidylserine decarboxylase [Chlamydiota bacterium]